MQLLTTIKSTDFDKTGRLKFKPEEAQPKPKEKVKVKKIEKKKPEDIPVGRRVRQQS